MTDSGAHEKRQRAFLRKKKVLQVFKTHTYSHNQAKRHQRVIMCTQKERAQTSNVTRFARDGVGPFDCTCVCWVELDTISAGKRSFALTKGNYCSFISRIPRRFPRTLTANK
uniref:(northern house mosquito) hypothetical protein n=1 Tax=Culex pipiens TaxID=7175 RepID=A0A8D8B8F1_CULPI